MKNHRPPSTLTLLLAPAIALLAATGGCSARLEVETTAADTDPPVAIERTAIGMDLFTDRESKPESEPVRPAATSDKDRLAQESRPAPEPVSQKAGSVSVEKSVKVVRNVVNIYEGDEHFHEHLHVHGSSGKPRKKRVKVRVEVVQKPQPNERCERLMKEHLSRLSKWEAMLQRGGR